MNFDWRNIIFILLLQSTLLLSHCGGGSGVDLSGDDSNVGNSSGDGDSTADEDSVGLSSETIEDEEVVYTYSEDDADSTTNEDVATIAPEMGIITSDSAYIDCSTRTEEGDPELDYVSLTCANETSSIEHHYYCTASVDEDDNEIFIVSRVIVDDESPAEELWSTSIVTCIENEDGSVEFFEEDYIVS